MSTAMLLVKVPYVEKKYFISAEKEVAIKPYLEDLKNERKILGYVLGQEKVENDVSLALHLRANGSHELTSRSRIELKQIRERLAKDYGLVRYHYGW